MQSDIDTLTQFQQQKEHHDNELKGATERNDQLTKELQELKQKGREEKITQK